MVSNPVDPNTGQAVYDDPANICVVRASTTPNYAGASTIEALIVINILIVLVAGFIGSLASP